MSCAACDALKARGKLCWRHPAAELPAVAYPLPIGTVLAWQARSGARIEYWKIARAPKAEVLAGADPTEPAYEVKWCHRDGTPLGEGGPEGIIVHDTVLAAEPAPDPGRPAKSRCWVVLA